MRNYYDESDVRRVTDHLADKIRVEFHANEPFNIVGIRTRGEMLAERLAELLPIVRLSPNSAAACWISRSIAMIFPRSAPGRWSPDASSISRSMASRCCWWTM